MSFALIATVMSSLCMALMVTLDRLMVGDCYAGKPNHAWFVSSVAGSFFGLLTTLLIWVWMVASGETDFGLIFETIQSFFLTKGLLMVLAGACAVQVLLHYFRCFGEEANSTAVASWLAATPIFIFLVLFCVSLLGGDLSNYLTEPIWIIGVVLATLGLVVFETITGGGQLIVKKKMYQKELFLMLFFNVVFAILTKKILTSSSGSDLFIVEVAALLPFYWIGFAAGMRVLMQKGEYASFKSNWRKRISRFIVPILVVEVIGMAVFLFEYLGLSGLDPVYVNIIIGAHVFLVYIFDLILGHVRTRMVTRKSYQVSIFGTKFLRDNLPIPRENKKMIWLELCAIAITFLGIVCVSLYSL